MPRTMKLNMNRDIILSRLRERLERITPKPLNAKEELANYKLKLQNAIAEQRIGAKKNYENALTQFNLIEKLLKRKTYSNVEELFGTLKQLVGPSQYIMYPERVNLRVNEHEIASIKHFIKTLEACVDETLALTMDDDIFRYLD